MKNLYSKVKYHLIIFTDNYKIFDNTNISVIKLKQNLDRWYEMKPDIKYNLYKEIYMIILSKYYT